MVSSKLLTSNTVKELLVFWEYKVTSKKISRTDVKTNLNHAPQTQV